MIQFGRIWILFMLGSALSGSYLRAQAPAEALGPVTDIQRAPWVDWAASVSRSFTKDTLSISASKPFFDDFSEGTVPDSGLWDLEATINPRYPLIFQATAVQPPSLGVLTFDGASPENRPYLEDLARGPADRLESHFINLSGYDTGDNLYLSFFLQPQGYGHQPTYRDSFKVYFNALTRPGGDTTELVKVFSKAGGPVAGFRQVMIPLDDPLFFHTRFYLVFESEGYLNGLLHAWHLDYVYLGLNRNAADTVYRDASVTYLSRSPLSPYTAIPYQQYQPNQFMRSFNVLGSYLGNSTPTISFSGTIIDPVGGNLPAPYQQSVSLTQVNHGPFQAGFGDYQDGVVLNSPYAASFLHEVAITSPADDHPENDRFLQEYRIDTLLAYDDGEADAGYGLNRARGFGQKYEIASEDSMMAVWICFVPQIDYIAGGSLEGAGFRITIWHDAHPDSVLYTQGLGADVVYGSAANHFERYALSQAVSVKGTIWVGITQLEDVAIGVGFDRTYNNNSYVYWDSSGTWVESRLNGTLMIRPEMRNILYNPGPFVDLEQEDITPAVDWEFFPNPLREGRLKISGSGLEHVREVKLSLKNLQGKKVYHAAGWQPEGYPIPLSLPGGVYLLRLDAVMQNGQPVSLTRKLLIGR